MCTLLEILRFSLTKVLLARLWRDSGEFPLNLIKRRLFPLRTNDIAKRARKGKRGRWTRASATETKRSRVRFWSLVTLGERMENAR